jgi:hypothetical protein
VAASTQVGLEADTTLLFALAPVTLCAAGIDANLSAHDAARFRADAETLIVHPLAAGGAFWLIEIRTA